MFMYMYVCIYIYIYMFSYLYASIHKLLVRPRSGPRCRPPASPARHGLFFKIHQRGVQWKQGVVIRMML